MILRSVILRGPVPGGGLKLMNLQVSSKDISLSVLVRRLTNLKLIESIQYCSIKKLEVNQKISQMVLYGKDSLDMSVIHILKKDIQVLELPLMMNRKLSLETLRSQWKQLNIPMGLLNQIKNILKTVG